MHKIFNFPTTVKAPYTVCLTIIRTKLEMSWVKDEKETETDQERIWDTI